MLYSAYTDSPMYKLQYKGKKNNAFIEFIYLQLSQVTYNSVIEEQTNNETLKWEKNITAYPLVNLLHALTHVWDKYKHVQQPSNISLSLT